MNDYLTAMETMSNIFDITTPGLQMFSKKLYKSGFEQVYHKLVPAFDAIERLYDTVGEPDVMIRNMADAVVSTAKKQVDDCKKRHQKGDKMINLNMQLAIYIYPCIMEYRGKSSQPLVDAIAGAWKEAFPKTNVTPASYEVIEKGFHRKFCYITTAVCGSLNAADDCRELTLLRDFRDGYMASLPNGEEMIRSYYDVAPTIVKHIDRLEDHDRIYQEIWASYIHPCIRYIEDGKNEECLSLYAGMLDDLKKRYFH